MLANLLSTSRAGRSILHLACAARRPRNGCFHFAGIGRELVCAGNGYYPTPGPLLPIGIAAAVALMAWWVLR